MKEINILKKMFWFRWGLTTFLALLALHVLFTIYKQLGQTSEILNELAEAGMIPIGYDEDKLDKSKYFLLPDYAGSRRHVNKFSLKGRGRREANPQFRSGQTDDGNFRTRQSVRESVFSYERQFYEADDQNQPRNFIETDPSLRTQKSRKHRDGEGVNRLGRIKDTDNSNKNNISKKKKNDDNSKGAKVIILAYRRSGSSFVGEMFNRNPRVFYLFEPIYPLQDIAGQGKFPLLYDMLVRHLWEVIYTCSFEKHPLVTEFLSRSSFRLKSEVLTNPNLCKIDAKRRLTMLECKPLNRTILSRLCNSKEHIVVKSIRTGTRKTFELTS
ncbi:uncharacterized protein LOC114531067 [Dendronephthya gigantea]|uniref:uncharacterized protein LOC114531067 n=1 Tax=Dendronephthya gigantea TaxID=151771 RepID=UPI0010696D26|nr:uncharacterized protein LOC114531067 [Dendronephthya gigantea]